MPRGKNMKIKEVVSSCFKGYGYDEEKQELDVVFNTGVTYGYEGVPKSLYEELEKAESKGSYFSRNIKPKFNAKKK